jgi:hypothetical protein
MAAATRRSRGERPKSLDLTWLTSPDEIPACHSSRGGEFGERIDSVKGRELKLAP